MVRLFYRIGLDLFCTISATPPNTSEDKIPAEAHTAEFGRKPLSRQHGRDDFIFTHSAFRGAAPCVRMYFDSERHRYLLV